LNFAKTRFKPLLGVKDPLMGFLKLTVARARKQATMWQEKKEILPLLSMICKHVVTE